MKQRGLLLVPFLFTVCCLLPSAKALAETAYMSPLEGLYLAVILDDMDEAVRWLDQGQDPNQADPEGDGCTVLTYARSTEMIELLLERGADPNHLCPDGLTLLHTAVSAPYGPRIIPVILDHGGLVNARYQDETPLHWSVTAWIEHASSDRPHADGAIIGLLAEGGADMDAPDGFGLTPLMIATQNDRPVLVGLLLNHGADPGATDPEGRTALDMALDLGFDEVVEVLSEASK